MFRASLGSVALFCVLAAPPAWASDVRGSVQLTVNGQPRVDGSGVVVFIADQALPTGPQAQAAMSQVARQFSPQVLVVPVGAKVAFPNHDSIEHNVFSNSPHATFDLGRYGPGAAKARVFDQPGVVDVYCNVHRDMIGHVVVVPGPWAITGKDGSFVITGVSSGHHELVIWDRLGNPVVQRRSIEVPATGEALLKVPIAESGDQEPPHPNKFGAEYRQANY